MPPATALPLADPPSSSQHRLAAGAAAAAGGSAAASEEAADAVACALPAGWGPYEVEIGHPSETSATLEPYSPSPPSFPDTSGSAPVAATIPAFDPHKSSCVHRHMCTGCALGTGGSGGAAGGAATWSAAKTSGSPVPVRTCPLRVQVRLGQPIPCELPTLLF